MGGEVPLGRSQPYAIIGWLHLHACEAIIWAYFVSNTLYKRWYLVSAFALALTVAFGLLGHLTLRGALRALLPFVLYHGYLLTAILRPSTSSYTTFITLADLVELAIVFLFWSLVRNHPFERVGMIFVRLPFFAALCTAVQVVAGGGNRAGGIGLIFVSVAVPFCYQRLMAERSRWLALSALMLCFAVAAISRSRSQTAAAVLALMLSFVSLGGGRRARLRALMLATLAVGVTLATLVSFAPTRLMLRSTYARYTGQDVLTATDWIPAEPDLVRERLDVVVEDLLWKVQPFGLGMGGVRSEYERRYGTPMTVHNAYHAWAVEGGVFCVLIMLWILARHACSLWHALHDPGMRSLALAVAIASLSTLAIGLYHQMHQAPALWILLGMGAGMRSTLVHGRAGQVHLGTARQAPAGSAR